MNEDMRKIFHEQLLKYMKLNNKTQSDISNDLGISLTTVSGWYHGNNFPRPDKMQLLADYFNINVEDLIKRESNNVSLSDIEFALYGEVKDLTDEEMEDVSNYIQFLKQKRKI